MTSPQQFDMEGVAIGEYMMVETTRPILVALNGTVLKWPVGSGTIGGAVLLSGSTITSIYFQNQSTTNLATVQVVVTD